MRKNKFFIAVLLFFYQVSSAQLPAKLDAETVQDMVRRYHPVAKQSALLTEQAAAGIQSAKGAFDPVFDWDIHQKTFDGKNYYAYNNPEISLPTLFALTVKGGVENNSGDLLSPEFTKGKSSYLGLEMPLGNGLLFDKRRAALQQAKLLKNQTEQERRNIINDLLLEATKNYWQWAGTYQLNNLIKAFSENAAKRHRLVKTAFEQGDRSQMDTLESWTQWQQYTLMQQAMQRQLNQAAIELSAFLWKPDETVYDLTPDILPDTSALLNKIKMQPGELIQQPLTNHPLLQSASSKIDILATEKKLKFQGLLPYVSVKANLLGKGYSVPDIFKLSAFQNNYKWGMGVTMPLFLRQARGEYKKAGLKVKEAQLEFSLKRVQVENKIEIALNEWKLQGEQLSLIEKILYSNQKLLQNEELKFSQGESSLFLVNAREIKLLETQQKKVELQIKLLMALNKIKWAAGLLN